MSEYIVIAVGGEMDGEEVFRAKKEIDAINWATIHEEDYPLGCAIFHGDEIINW